ncbi:ribonuclease H-like domain-containing protein [Tanacetum coccineum]
MKLSLPVGTTYLPVGTTYLPVVTNYYNIPNRQPTTLAQPTYTSAAAFGPTGPPVLTGFCYAPSGPRIEYGPEVMYTTLPQAFNTMTLQEGRDARWYMDTGATSHLASDSVKLTTIFNKSVIPSILVGNVKVRWDSKRGPELTWERKDQMRGSDSVPNYDILDYMNFLKIIREVFGSLLLDTIGTSITVIGLITVSLFDSERDRLIIVNGFLCLSVNRLNALMIVVDREHVPFPMFVMIDIEPSQMRIDFDCMPKAAVSDNKGNEANVVKASACWGNPLLELQEKGVINSGCSRHMTGNKSYLSDYEEIDGGFVAFGGDPKGGRITGLNINLKLDNQIIDPTRQHIRLLLLVIDSTAGEDCRKYSKSLLLLVVKLLLLVLVTTARRASSVSYKLVLLVIFVMNQLCEIKGIKREFSVARTPQQNGVAERKNKTLIEAARTMLTDSKLPTTFWAEAVNIACYV